MTMQCSPAHNVRHSGAFRVFCLWGVLAAWCPAFGQTPAVSEASKPLHIVNIRFGHYAGMCYGYCDSELEVNSSSATLLWQAHREEQWKYRTLKVTADVSSGRWRDLQHAVDREAFLALPKSIGCPGCGDEVIEAIEITFSDRSKKSVEYIAGSAPKELRDLSEKLSALERKLTDEFPKAWLRE